MHDSYRALANPPFSPPDMPPALVEELQDALNTLGTPTADALTALSPDMVELAFNSLAPKDRQRLLSRLGIKMAAPRRASKSLCRDILDRALREARHERCLCAARSLTRRVIQDVNDAVWAAAGSAHDLDPVSRWGSSLALVSVFAWSQASALDARTFLWAAEQGWFGLSLGIGADALAAVEAAAAQVVAATPGFNRSRHDHSEAVREPAGAEDETMPEVEPAAAAAEAPEADGQEVSDAYEALELSVAAARSAAERIGDLLSLGCPPAESDVLLLSTLPSAFARMQQVLEAAGAGRVEPRLDDLAAAVAACLTARERDGQARLQLRNLLAISCATSSGAAQALGVAHERARQLLAAEPWDQSAHSSAQALSALVELVALSGRQDALAQVIEKQQFVGQVLPECVMAAVLFSELVGPAPTGETELEPVHGATLWVPAEPTETDSGSPTPVLGAAAASTEHADPDPVDSAVDHPSSQTPAVVAAPAADRAQEDATTSTVSTATPPAMERRHSKTTPDETPVPALTEIDVVEDSLRRLVTEGRFGLAAHLSQAAERSATESAVLRLAAAGTALWPGSSVGARTFDEALQHWDAIGTRFTADTDLLLLAPLVRAALITGEPVIGAQLKTLSPRLPEALSAFAIAVADAALSGALMIARPMAVSAHASESESRLREVVQQCQELRKPPRLRFHRATHIAKRWLAPDGLLGATLVAMIQDAPDANDRAQDLLSRLDRLPDIHSEIDRIDRELRGPSGQQLQGSGRQDLVQIIERTTDTAKTWLGITQDVQRLGGADSNWAFQEVAGMRQAVLGNRERLLGELDSAMRRSEALRSAAAWAAREALTAVLHELEHGTAAQQFAAGIDIREVIDAELLKIPAFNGSRPSVPDLLAAVDRSWQEALELHERQDAFGAAYRILDLATQNALPGKVSLPVDEARRLALLDTEVRRRGELGRRHEELVAELRRAQADSALSDDQDLNIQELLSDAAPESEDSMSRDLSVVRRTLDTVAELLPRYRTEAADRLRARLDAVVDLSEAERTQVLRHLNTDGLATAADLVYFLELGEPVPEIVSAESHLSDFFPSVPADLPDGITAELVEAVRAGATYRRLPILDYGRLSGDEAEQAAKALEQWRELTATEPKERQNVNVRVRLLPALKLLGYEAKQARPLHELPRSNEYRFADVSEIEINGRAWAPTFGTKILENGGKLRILMLWGRPSAKLLLSRAAQEPSGGSLLVVYFGTLGSDARGELARAAQGGAPLMVVDDAALAYLAAHGNRQVSVATETLLPFSGVNPYIREKRGRIGREMFYGRDAERKSILDPDGTQIIFGGRGLGKSALLNDAGDRFAEQQPGYHEKLYLNLDHYYISKATALGSETIWSFLEQELMEQRVLARPQRRKALETKPYERVRAGIKEWLAGEPRRRLLILMDECDLFFEADVPYCTETRRLRGLCVETQGRLKVVFAGLHSVQRFTRLARNGPFSHLAQTPTVVGPLAPQFAADLLVAPMRALGFEFTDIDLVNRVLGYCSYQPFLLQMFGSRLVEAMQHRRARGDLLGPPYAIQTSEVEAVESDPSLRADITVAFKETLTLDDRYDVIANVLARHARDYGLETRLSDGELRDECASWWRRGFEQLDSEGFRAYLQEMVGLGVLAPNHDGRGWHLRGPNALRMIGTAKEIETRLLSAETECRLEETVVQEGRPGLSGRRAAPLTVTQIDDLLGNHSNQVRVVLGTRATGVADVEETLRAVTGQVAGWNLPPIGRVSVFRQELTAGRPGEQRVIISDLTRHQANEEACQNSLALADTLLPTRAGVTRSVVLIAGTSQLGLWRDLLSAPDMAASITVQLRRHDKHSLKSWAQYSSLFVSEEHLARLLSVTGGWPILLDRAVFYATSDGESQALRRLHDDLKGKDLALDLVDAVGVTADPLVASGLRAVVEEFGDDWTREGDALTAMELSGLNADDAQWALSCLAAFQAFERENSQLRIEPVLYTCWSKL